MSEQDRASAVSLSPGDALAQGEQEQLAYALETRFAPHLEAAALAVREAERALTEAQERLARAERTAEAGRYTSDPRPFMRGALDDEAEGIGRKTTGKKIRASYRFLLDRAVDLAAAEVQGFEDDRAADLAERTHGVQACHVAVQQAAEALEHAQQLQEHVRAAERSARQGLAVMVDKLSAGA